MEKLPWNPSKDVIRVSANNLGIDIDRAIYTAIAIDYSRQSTERAEKNNIVRFGMCNVSIPKKRCLATKFPQNCIAATMDEISTHILQCSLEKRTIHEMLLRFTSIM